MALKPLTRFLALTKRVVTGPMPLSSARVFRAYLLNLNSSIQAANKPPDQFWAKQAVWVHKHSAQPFKERGGFAPILVLISDAGPEHINLPGPQQMPQARSKLFLHRWIFGDFVDARNTTGKNRTAGHVIGAASNLTIE